MGDIYYLGNARSQAQYDEMVRLEAAGVCLFCTKGLQESRKSILGANTWWTLVHNDYPYAGTLHHFLLIPSRHILEMTDLYPEEFAGMAPLIEFAKSKYQFEYYGIGARNGDPAYTGGTIKHLHLHLIVGDPNTDEPVRLKLSSRPK